MNVLSLNTFGCTIVKKENTIKSCVVLSVMVNFVRAQTIYHHAQQQDLVCACRQVSWKTQKLGCGDEQRAGAGAPSIWADVAGKLAVIRFPVSGALMA